MLLYFSDIKMSTEDKCQGSASSTSENDITKSKRINAADNTASDNDHFTFSNDCTLEEMLVFVILVTINVFILFDFSCHLEFKIVIFNKGQFK